MPLEMDVVVQVLLKERRRVTAFAAAVVRDVHAADDIFQQVVLTAIEDRTRFSDTEHLMAWSLRTARHRAIDWVRTRQLRPLPDDVLDLLEARWSEPGGAGWSDRAEALNRCVGRLGEAARNLLHMRYADGMTAVAIADALSRSAAAVYQTLSRIHRSLRECVEGELAGIAHPATNTRGVSQ
jgi:RNA polymerase sigma-70 factor